MKATENLSVLRRRRTVEASALVSRGAGLLCTVLFLAGRIGMPASLLEAPTIRLACWAGIVLMVGALGLAVINLRFPGGRWYRLLSGVQVVADTVTIGAITVAIQADHGQTTWPLLAVPVLTAALRQRLLGALLAWAVTSGILVLAVDVMEPGDFTMAVLVNLLIAILSGTQSSAYSRQFRELDEIRHQLHHQANHDPLTGLPNRERLTSYAGELDGRPLAVLLLDLDGFKAVNDTLGHAAGDELLRVVADRLRAELRAGDLAGRIGGDEFVVVLADADQATADGLATRLRAAIGRPLDVRGRPVSVGVSIGVACRPAGAGIDLEALSATADAAMYEEKSQRTRTAPVSAP